MAYTKDGCDVELFFCYDTTIYLCKITDCITITDQLEEDGFHQMHRREAIAAARAILKHFQVGLSDA